MALANVDILELKLQFNGFLVTKIDTFESQLFMISSALYILLMVFLYYQCPCQRLLLYTVVDLFKSPFT